MVIFMKKTKKRIYVCHTFYHVYVTLLKEFALPKEELGWADIVLSKLSNDFGDMKLRLEKSGLFQAVYELDEKRYDYFPHLIPYREDKGNIVAHLWNRMIFTKKYPKALEPFMYINFKEYEDIYVFCDSDPIGFYLNYKRIPYHALEDGLDCLKYLDAARYDNRGHFRLKAFLSSLNLIFIQNGYGKYCMDMEINDKSCLKYDCPKYKVVPRKPLEKQLSKEAKEQIVKVFVPAADELLLELKKAPKENGFVLLLTQPLCELAVREKMFKDIIATYCGNSYVVLKPHPRDELDYKKAFPECTVIEGKFPIEVLNFLPDVHFNLAISVFTTALDTVDFVDEKINLGADFMDAYEAPEKHHFNDKI